MKWSDLKSADWFSYDAWSRGPDGYRAWIGSGAVIGSGAWIGVFVHQYAINIAGHGLRPFSTFWAEPRLS